MERPYLKVTPANATYEAGTVRDVLRGLSGITSAESPSLLERLTSLGGPTSPTFEFVAVTEGAGAPVEFYYGVDEAHIETLAHRLEELYPDAFRIERVTTDIAKKLVTPVEYDLEAFAAALDAGDLWVTPDTTTTADATTTADGTTTADTRGRGSDSAPGSSDDPAATDGGTASAGAPTAQGVALDLDPPSAIPEDGSRCGLDGPTRTEAGTVLARPGPDAVEPVGYRWVGVGDRKRDWMTRLHPYSEAHDNARPPSADADPGEERSPLVGLVESLADATVPLAFQVVFEPTPDWSAEASLRIEDIRRSEDTRLDRVLSGVFGMDMDEKPVEELPAGERGRVRSIEASTPTASFTANLRALSVRQDGREDRDWGPSDPTDGPAPAVEELSSLFGEVDGEFYRLEPERIDDYWLLARRGRRRARAAFDRFREREVVAGSGRRRPGLVVSPDELANFVAIPSADTLPETASRQTTTRTRDRAPLPRPTPDRLAGFRDGMACGHAIDATGAPREDVVRIPPSALDTHYARVAPTGAGKSVALLTDLLSLHAETDGPVVFLDRKGDGMCEEYLASHYARFGDLDGVSRIELPQDVPAVPLFDIRPALAEGRDRATAIQGVVEHFHEVMRSVMGQETYERAYVAKAIIGNLVRALFDAEYGQDAFGLDALHSAALRMQREQLTPPLSRANSEIESMLLRHFEKDDRSFQRNMDAVLNRLEEIENHPTLAAMLNSVPEWDARRGTYAGSASVLEFRDLLDSDGVVLLDLGGLGPDQQDAVTMVVLHALWDALQQRKQSPQDAPTLVNLLVDEAAPVVASDLVGEDLLPQGRAYGLGLGLAVQFPGQVRQASERAYAEFINEVQTMFVGNVSVDPDLARSLAHGDLDVEAVQDRLNRLPPGEWIADLPSPAFGEASPPPFSLASLDVPAGHSESDAPLRGHDLAAFQSARRAMRSRVRGAFCLDD